MTDTVSDTLGEALVNAGLVANAFVLDLNHSLMVPADFELGAPWDLPSRLFQFPIEVSEPIDGVRRIGLRHPLLAEHPFVQHVEKLLGLTLEPDGAPNRFGVSNCAHAMWWHAVDLVTAGKWRELIETRRFTTTDHIAGSVSYGLQYSSHTLEGATGYLSTAEARQIMAAIGAAEPTDRRSAATGFAAPQPSSPEKGAVHWPINTGPRRASAVDAWGFIIGIEDGWFKHDRAGFLGWTQSGRDRYTAGDEVTFTEAGGQGAFAF